MSEFATAREHESAFVRSFVIRERQERYLEQLASSKRRPKFLDRLNHELSSDLVGRYLLDKDPRVLDEGQRQCYLIADDSDQDGKFVSESELSRILESTYFGIVISIVPGKLACYKAEVPAEPIWMQRD